MESKTIYTHTHTRTHRLDTVFLRLGDSVIPSRNVFSTGRGSMLIGLEGHTAHSHTHTITFACLLTHIQPQCINNKPHCGGVI